MLTQDENVVRVEMDVRYRVVDPEQYLFSVTNADEPEPGHRQRPALRGGSHPDGRCADHGS